MLDFITVCICEYNDYFSIVSVVVIFRITFERDIQKRALIYFKKHSEHKTSQRYLSTIYQNKSNTSLYP